MIGILARVPSPNPLPDAAVMDGTFSQAERLTSMPGAAEDGSAGAADDAALIQAGRDGDAAALGQLVRRYQDRVFNLCLRMCGSREDAEDHTQEAFVRAIQSLDKFAERSRFYTWVFRIAVNLVVSAKRKTDRRATFSLDAPRRRGDGDDGESRSAQLAADDSPPDQRMENQERNRQVMAAMSAIDDEHRTVLVLRDVESLSYDEIADILDVPTGTVKSRLHRARLALRERLLPLMGLE